MATPDSPAHMGHGERVTEGISGCWPLRPVSTLHSLSQVDYVLKPFHWPPRHPSPYPWSRNSDPHKVEQKSGATPETPLHSETKSNASTVMFSFLWISVSTLIKGGGWIPLLKNLLAPKTPDRRKNWTEAWTGVRVGSLTPVCSPCEPDIRPGGEVAAVSKSLA